MPRSRKDQILLKKMAAQASAEQARRLERGPPPKDEPFWRIGIGSPDPSWRTVVTMVLRHGRPVVRDLEIVLRPDSDYDMPPSGLTSTHLRKIHLTLSPSLSLEEAATRAFEQAGIPVGRVKLPRGAKRKARYTDDGVARFAALYLEAVATTPNPRPWLHARYSKDDPHLPRDWVPEMLRRATKRGFLTAPAYAGDRTPRQPTPKLDEWIKANADAKATPATIRATAALPTPSVIVQDGVPRKKGKRR